MRKEALVFLCLIFLFQIYPIYADTITGESITGKVSNSVGLNISLTAYFPVFTIFSPIENAIYLKNSSLLLNYSVINNQSVWYNLDNGINRTISTTFLIFNTSQGGHILYLYANSSFGNMTSKNVSFSVNLTRFIINYSSFESAGEPKGQTTDFLGYSFNELQNLSNIILHQPDYGKIKFLTIINLTNDSILGDNFLDISNNINISTNRIEVNSTALPNFNISATLWLFNLNFVNPRILKNNVLCPETECKKESYSSGELKFNVTSFTIYSAEETPTAVSAVAPQLGGGGGAVTKIENFILDKEQLKVSLRQGETVKDSVRIKNIGTMKIKILVELRGLENFTKISEQDFEISPNETKEIIIDFLVREDSLPDIYIGKIVFKSQNIKREILTSLNIASKKALFDLKVEIPNKFLSVNPGEEVVAELTLLSFGKFGRIDANLEYGIKDSLGNTLLVNSEQVAVETQLILVKSFKIPSYFLGGDYFFYSKATYNGEMAVASATFKVQPSIEFPKMKIYAFFLIFIVLIIVLIRHFIILMRTKKKISRE